MQRGCQGCAAGVGILDFGLRNSFLHAECDAADLDGLAILDVGDLDGEKLLLSANLVEKKWANEAKRNDNPRKLECFPNGEIFPLALLFNVKKIPHGGANRSTKRGLMLVQGPFVPP